MRSGPHVAVADVHPRNPKNLIIVLGGKIIIFAYPRHSLFLLLWDWIKLDNYVFSWQKQFFYLLSLFKDIIYFECILIWYHLLMFNMILSFDFRHHSHFTVSCEECRKHSEWIIIMLPFCRVCQEEKEEALINLGCLCRGGLAKAHHSCIVKWFNTRGSNKCEICQLSLQNFTEYFQLTLWRLIVSLQISHVGK